MKKRYDVKTGGSTMSTRKPICRIIGIIVLMAVGFLVIPPLMEKYSNKIYKFSLKKDNIDFENMGPEVVNKEESKGE